jgi:hypothetical protein
MSSHRSDEGLDTATYCKYSNSRIAAKLVTVNRTATCDNVLMLFATVCKAPQSPTSLHLNAAARQMDSHRRERQLNAITSNNQSLVCVTV